MGGALVGRKRPAEQAGGGFLMPPETNSGGFVDMNDGMLQGILKRGREDMPKKYQNPRLEKRTDVSVPYWFIRVRVPDPSKKRTRTPLKLGFCHEMNQKEAMQQ